jgi:uncharacterized protein YjbI with pentapeptide repeats
VNLWGANLWGADLSGADMRGANLEGADLCGVTGASEALIRAMARSVESARF